MSESDEPFTIDNDLNQPQIAKGNITEDRELTQNQLRSLDILGSALNKFNSAMENILTSLRLRNRDG